MPLLLCHLERWKPGRREVKNWPETAQLTGLLPSLSLLELTSLLFPGTNVGMGPHESALLQHTCPVCATLAINGPGHCSHARILWCLVWVRSGLLPFPKWLSDCLSTCFVPGELE